MLSRQDHCWVLFSSSTFFLLNLIHCHGFEYYLHTEGFQIQIAIPDLPTNLQTQMGGWGCSSVAELLTSML
jgi:hypothetical protein